ncbi:MAG TPA: extracellular solute-binding protein [Verrucomicrobiales bacterium]|jgi:ABC-type Fe3+ transport system substrate-binding protein|nr:extracellular solute-binding protein [Verrucomicrobiales bacterium]
MKRYLLVLLAMAAVIAAPILLRPAESARTLDYAKKDRLAIISPHVETLRYELERAFVRWMKEKHGRKVVIDWRIPGGTSDIIKVVNAEYAAVGKSAGIGMDLMFGGGPIDYGGLKQSGYIVAADASGKYGPSAVKSAHPDWFSDAAIPASVAGQIYYDPDLVWIGTCLSAFGICWNRDNLERRGISPPVTWSDLTDPAYENQLAVSDPNKSGTVAKMFEDIIQMNIIKSVAAGKSAGESPDGEAARIAAGWEAGLREVRRIGANARYWTDSSHKIPLDVAGGEALAGMCVDFYGRNFIERLTSVNGASRLGFIAPLGGSTISPQPVAMFRGAPNPELATRFIEFILSLDGQKIWGLKAGVPGGPEKMALRNMPLRRDFYVPEILKDAADPELRPLEPGTAFVYQGKYTGAFFSSIRFLIRTMCIDPHLELKEAWHELVAHHFPPQATAAFEALPDSVGYEAVKKNVIPMLKTKDPLADARTGRELSEQFRNQYLRVRDLAREGK